MYSHSLSFNFLSQFKFRHSSLYHFPDTSPSTFSLYLSHQAIQTFHPIFTHFSLFSSQENFCFSHLPSRNSWRHQSFLNMTQEKTFLQSMPISILKFPLPLFPLSPKTPCPHLLYVHHDSLFLLPFPLGCSRDSHTSQHYPPTNPSPPDSLPDTLPLSPVPLSHSVCSPAYPTALFTPHYPLIVSLWPFFAVLLIQCYSSTLRHRYSSFDLIAVYP